MKNKRLKNIPIILLICALLFVLSAALVNIFQITTDYNKSEEEYDNIRTVATVTKKEQEEGQPLYTYKEIDWDELKEINEDIIGWIYIPDTPVDYPILQGESNDTYLRTTYTGKRASAGSIFMECQNTPDFSDKNTILYGHNMRNGSMFNCLSKFSNKEFFDAHPIVQIYTPMWSKTYKIYSVHTDVNTGDSYKISFINVMYDEWVKDMARRTLVKGQEASEFKDTVTLSVCHGKSGTSQRMVLHLQVADDYMPE